MPNQMLKICLWSLMLAIATPSAAESPLDASTVGTPPCGDSAADSRRGEDGVDALIVTFLDWIIAKTGYAAPAPPRIALVPKHEIAQLPDGARSGDQLPQKMVLGDQGPQRAGDSLALLAFYVHANATIYLPETWCPVGLHNQGILLHELVHHVQRFNKVTPSCPAALERQAYDLQATWLREQGIADPYEASGLDQFTVLILTTCMPVDW